MSDKRIQIIKAAIKLFAKDGVGVATSKIATEADVSNGTLFNYFASKQILINDTYLYTKEKIADEIMKDVHSDMDIKDMSSAIWSGYINWSLKNAKEHKVLELLRTSQLLSSNVLRAGESFFTVAFKALNDAILKKTVKEMPIEMIFEIAGGQLNSTIHYIQEYKVKKADIPDIIELSFNIHWEGIGQ